MTKYEIMYVIRPTATEERRKELMEELHEIFTSRGSEIVNVNEWGMRDLAYEIQKHKKGYYVVVDVLANDDARNEFDRVVKIREDVIRYMILKDVR